MPLPKPCEKCGRRIVNRTKRQTLCSECQQIVKNVNFIKLLCSRYNMDLDTLVSNW